MKLGKARLRLYPHVLRGYKQLAWKRAVIVFPKEVSVKLAELEKEGAELEVFVEDGKLVLREV